MQSNNIWQELVDYARWSASPHNVQPWKVKILSDTEAELQYDPKRLLPVEDYTGCFMTVGFGIFIENLSIAAAGHGLIVKEDYQNIIFDAEKKELTLFAKLKLMKRTVEEKELFDKELIKTRRTSRLKYDGRPVPDDMIKELEGIAKKFGHTFTFSKEDNMIDWVLKLNRDTIFYDMNDKATRDEIGMWLRYSAEEAKKKKDGLWSYAMRFPGPLMFLFFHARFMFNLPIVSSIAKDLYLQSTQGTKTVGWLSGPFETPADWLNAGHMLARLWLCLSKHEVYLHPFGSIITNKESHKRLQEKFNLAEGKNKIWLLVRLGYSEVPPRSYRLSVNDIVINN